MMKVVGFNRSLSCTADLGLTLALALVPIQI